MNTTAPMLLSPVRNRNSAFQHVTPSTSGGFYVQTNISHNLQGKRTYSENEKMAKKLERSSSPSLLIKTLGESSSKASVKFQDEYSVSALRSLKDDTVDANMLKRAEDVKKYKANYSLTEEFRGDVSAAVPILAPALVNSFSKFLPPPIVNQIVIENSDKSCQTEDPLSRRVFDNLSEYQTWVDEEVEPFLKTVRKVIMKSKPEDITAFMIAYCESLQMDQDIPETIVNYRSQQQQPLMSASTRRSLTGRRASLQITDPKLLYYESNINVDYSDEQI